MNKINFIAVFLYIHSASLFAFAPPQGEDIIAIGCTLPSPSGAFVYSIEASKPDGNGGFVPITLPLGVEAGAPCSAALIAMAQNKPGPGNCPIGWSPAEPFSTKDVVYKPKLITIPGSDYALQWFGFKCGL